jgi:L-ascorbate peroxidase
MNLNHIAKKPFFDLFYRSPCMAQMLRLAYHDAGFCRSSVLGGSRGTLRFPDELKRHENSGLEFAMEQIQELQEDGNHITAILSYADLIQLGGYAAVEYAGGPSMVFRMGRKDAEESELPQLTHGEGNKSMIEKVEGFGFTRREFVTLMGSHTLGFANMEVTGPQGRWTQNPHVFDNTYYKEVLLGDRSKFLKTKAEILLATDPELRAYCEEYAQDENLFFREYAVAHVKMSELGQEKNLLSEFDEASSKANGGYIEPQIE